VCVIVDPLAFGVPQFVNPLPVVQDLGLRVDATTNNSGAGFAVVMDEVPGGQNLLGAGFPNTPVWGYSVDGFTPVTYPGATFVAQSGTPVDVLWANFLPTNHLLPVDTTLHWALGKEFLNAVGVSQTPFPPGDPASDAFTAVGGIPAVAHLHGGHTDSAYDGLPEQWFTPGGFRGLQDVAPGGGPLRLFTYDNSQEAATLWYHDHALGITRLNVYAGLAGFYLLRDANELALINGTDGVNQIPGGAYEIEMAIQDRMFSTNAAGTTAELYYPASPPLGTAAVFPSALPEFFGNIILVNGKAWPFLNVAQAQYRFRLLNGSDSRFYVLDIKTASGVDGPNFWVIGTDTGLLNAPVPANKLTIGPGERYDVVVDFSGTLDGVASFGGETLTVRNTGRSPFPKGATVNPNLDGKIMQFIVSPTETGPTPLTATTNLRPLSGPIPALTATAPPRGLMLFEAIDDKGRLQPLLGTVGGTFMGGTPGDADGTQLWDDEISENPALDTTELWEVYNATVDAHPIHLHLVAFQIVNRQKFTATVVPKTNVDPNGIHGPTIGGSLTNIRLKGQPKGPGAYEAGFKDTAIMNPDEVTRVIATFDKPGRYVWHCHILSHEDHEMMRPFFVQ
jgi:spore coat protein A